MGCGQWIIALLESMGGVWYCLVGDVVLNGYGVFVVRMLGPSVSWLLVG